jgi:nitrogen fixation NifU-like protein
MGAADDVYQQLLLDHSKSPRNRGALAHPTGAASRDNPLCGDSFTVAVEVAPDGRVADVRFEGRGCAISVASASMMTERARGLSPPEVEALFQRFDRLVAGEAPPAPMGDLAAFAGVARFPVRGKCARLPWQALLAALDVRR